MNSLLSDIKAKMVHLSDDEKLWLIEQLAHGLRHTPLKSSTTVESQLATMAADADIQRELKAIEREFASTESDGLERR